jgi:hypothetical protein
MDDSTPTTTTPTPGLVPDPASGAPAVPPSPAPGAPASSTFGGPASPPPATPSSSWAAPTDAQHRDGGGRTAGIVFGLIVLGVGLWFFADRTLGLDLPDIRWSQLWPLILVVIGVAILVGALRRDRR